MGDGQLDGALECVTAVVSSDMYWPMPPSSPASATTRRPDLSARTAPPAPMAAKEPKPIDPGYPDMRIDWRRHSKQRPKRYASLPTSTAIAASSGAWRPSTSIGVEIAATRTTAAGRQLLLRDDERRRPGACD
jgi:hypothetical protein